MMVMDALFLLEEEMASVSMVQLMIVEVYAWKTAMIILSLW